MVNMNQGDLFKLIVDLKFARKIEIARAIVTSAKDQLLDEKTLGEIISRATHGKSGKPFENILGPLRAEDFANTFFSIIFKDCDIAKGASETIALDKYEAIKNYLSENDLSFYKKDSLIENKEPCETFIKQMIVEAMNNHEPHTEKEKKLGNRVPIVTNISTYNVPSLHSQTIYCPSKFFGRDDYLEHMHKLMVSYKLVILCGIGGIGKTFLSRQYAHTYRDEYKCEQIVTYDKTTKSLEKTILSLSFDNLYDSDMSDKDKFEKRMSLLRNIKEDTLLIIDNVDSTPDDLNVFSDLCTNSNVHILITTRLTDCFPIEQTISVKPLSMDDQLNFFRLHYDFMDDETSTIKQILECIAGHTLLIELIAKSMHAGELSPDNMLAYLKGADLDEELLPISINKDSLSYEKRTMDDFIKLLFDVGYLDDTAKKALLYLSLLPIEGVGRKFFYNLMPKYRKYINELTSNSWAINEDKILRLHPVIRDMVRKEMIPSFKNCESLISNIHTLMQTPNNNMSDQDTKNICMILQSINEIDDFYDTCNNITLLSNFADFCFKAYDFELALELYITAARIAEDGPVQTLTGLYLNIGDVYKRLAKLSKSIESYQKALESNERQHAGHEKNLQEADIYLLMSDVYRKNSQYEQAMQTNDAAIKIYKNKKNKAKLSQLAESFNRRGIIFLNQAEAKTTKKSDKPKLLEEALKCYKKGLDLRLETGENGRQLAYSYHNIGTAYNKLGVYDLAKENHKKALDLRKECPNVPKTDIASSDVWLGNDYMAEGELMEYAKRYFEESLKIREEILGKTHPEVAWSLMSLSNWYNKMGDYKNALDYAKKAYEIRVICYPPSHNYVISAEEYIKELENKLKND